MRRLLVTGLFSVVLVGLGGTASAEELTPGGTFIDDDRTVYEPSIEAIYKAGITVGCSDRAQFCPERSVTRGEMAAFLNRALGLPATHQSFFTDTGDSIFAGDIDRLAAAGITMGCNPPANDLYCPERAVTRGEMATLLVRVFDLPETTESGRFVDTGSSVHHQDIDRLAAAGITVGCNPPDNNRYCPHDRVLRGEMAIFLTRAIPLEPIKPPPRPPTHLVARFTTFHNCCEARVTNIQVMARAMDGALVLPWETFSLNAYVGPRTEAKGYVPAPILLDGQGHCCAIGGGTSQFGTTFYNSIFWGAYEEVDHTPHSRYIDRYPLGIEATLGYPGLDVAFRNDTWTPVIIRTSYTSTSITVELWGNNGGRTVVGWHRPGNTSIDVTRSGGDSARRVTASVTGSATWSTGGLVTVTRTLDGPDGTTSKTWNHWYRGD